jgi:hypothetical protein
MKNIETRKTIALAMAASYIVFMGYCLWTGKQLPPEFVGTVSVVVGYYFGKSTALEMPKGGE